MPRRSTHRGLAEGVPEASLLDVTDSQLGAGVEGDFFRADVGP